MRLTQSASGKSPCDCSCCWSPAIHVQGNPEDNCLSGVLWMLQDLCVICLKQQHVLAILHHTSTYMVHVSHPVMVCCSAGRSGCRPRWRR